MNSALKDKLREANLPASVYYRLTETSIEDAALVLHGIKGKRAAFIAHAKNQLDAQRIKKAALALAPEDFEEIIVVAIAPGMLEKIAF